MRLFAPSCLSAPANTATPPVPGGVNCPTTGPTAPNNRARLVSSARRTMAKDKDRKSTRLNSSHDQISYAVFCLKKKKKKLCRIQKQESPPPHTAIGPPTALALSEDMPACQHFDSHPRVPARTELRSPVPSVPLP